MLTRGITNPLNKLVETATAVGEGDLDQRTGINAKDEIGQLATSFDLMTGRLSQRNDQLLKQTSELETILNSITDGVILLDNQDNIISANSAAQQLLADLSYDFLATGPFRELNTPTQTPHLFHRPTHRYHRPIHLFHQHTTPRHHLYQYPSAYAHLQTHPFHPLTHPFRPQAHPQQPPFRL